MIASDLALACDPVQFMRRTGLEPHPWQVHLLRAPAKNIIVNASRQSGKSSATAVLALHTALYVPASLVLLLAPALRQSQELFCKVKDAYGLFDQPSATAREESQLRLGFDNGSRIVWLPGKEQTIRGFSGVALLVVDEASRVPDELYQAVRPMLAVSRGRLILLSTPFGKRRFFHYEWTEGMGWERIKITVPEIPRIPADWLERERLAIGEWWFNQEHLSEFEQTTDSVFSAASIDDAFVDDLPPLFLEDVAA